MDQVTLQTMFAECVSNIGIATVALHNLAAGNVADPRVGIATTNMLEYLDANEYAPRLLTEANLIEYRQPQSDVLRMITQKLVQIGVFRL
jgi:DNA topoisomerase VI subunit B